eukprot:COSAG01_NODE_24692_length_766_cov_1.444113_1_plen_74_part_10
MVLWPLSRQRAAAPLLLRCFGRGGRHACQRRHPLSQALQFVDYRAPVDMALRLLDDMQVKQFIATGCLELRITE